MQLDKCVDEDSTFCVFALAGDELTAVGPHHFHPGPGYILRVLDTRPHTYHRRDILHDHLGYDLCRVSNILVFYVYEPTRCTKFL